MASFRLLSDFYKSNVWISLRRNLMIERADPINGLCCEYCKQPILKDIDCIGHHMKELTVHNVNDVNISLNPDNIMLVHQRCHNAIHDRFGQWMPQKVFIVYGAPLSGKTTFVRDSKGRRDIVLDMDELYQAITLLPPYDKPNELAVNVFQIRDLIIDQVKTRTGKWQQAWIIGGYPLQTERERLANQLGAELIFVDSTEQECIARLYNDEKKLPYRSEWERYIREWFTKYRPDQSSF